MTVPVRVTLEAREDIFRGKRYFDRKRYELGDEFIDEVLGLLDRIGESPRLYGEVGFGARAAGLKRFGYVAYYRIDQQGIEILAVLHGARSADIWKERASR